jgi:hypothetical protein
MNDQISPRHELFLKGAPHYLKALSAIEAFDSEVWRTCEDVYNRHKDELESCMGLTQRECEHYSDRDLPEWAAVGATRPTRHPDRGFYLYLIWREAEDGLEVAAHVWLEVYPKKDREQILKDIVRKNRPCSLATHDNAGVNSFYLEKVLDPNRLDSAGAELDDLVRQWIVYCKSVGGLKLMEGLSP